MYKICRCATFRCGATGSNLHDEVLTLSDIATFPILSFSRNSGSHRFLERLFDDTAGKQVRVNCMTSVSAMVRLVVDGFGLAMIPPAIIQREFANYDLQLLQMNTAMPNMSLVCSYRAGPETPLFQQIASAAQQTAQDFARVLHRDVARMPTANASGDPWTIATGLD